MNFTGTEEQWNKIKNSDELTSLNINFNVADPNEAPLEGTEGWLTFRTADGQATITAVDISAEGELIIPPEIFGCPVIAVAENAFNGVENITNVHIPASLVTLNDIAEAKHTVDQNNPVYSSDDNGILFNKDKTVLVCVPAACDIRSYTIPDTVKDIGNTFYDCDKIEQVTMSYSVTSWSLEAFSGCKNLKSIKLSSGLINIPTKAFQSCKNLESIIIPNSIISMDGMAFTYCSNLKDVYYTGS